MRQHPISGDINRLKNELSELEKMDIKLEAAIMNAAQFSALASSIKGVEQKVSEYFSAVCDGKEYYANISAYLSHNGKSQTQSRRKKYQRYNRAPASSKRHHAKIQKTKPL